MKWHCYLFCTMMVFCVVQIQTASYITRLWTPPATPALMNKTVNEAMQQHLDVQKTTNRWFLPSRSVLAGSVCSLAGYCMGNALKRATLTAALTGSVGMGVAWLLLSMHPEIKKRRNNQHALREACNISFLQSNDILSPDFILQRYQNRSVHNSYVKDAFFCQYFADRLTQEGASCHALYQALSKPHVKEPEKKDQHQDQREEPKEKPQPIKEDKNFTDPNNLQQEGEPEEIETGTRAEQVGNKAANLERLAGIVPALNKEVQRENRFVVPPLFAITHKEIEQFLSRDNFVKRGIDKNWTDFKQEFSSLSKPSFIDLEFLRKKIVEAFESFGIKNKARNCALQNFLTQAQSQGIKLMVRSTGKEDGEIANAGGNESLAAIEPNPECVTQAMGQVIASYFSEKSIKQQTLLLQKLHRKVDFGQPFYPVMLQYMIGETTEVPVSGVIYSQETTGHTPGIVHIEAAYGHNQGVVNGLVATDSYYVGPTNVIHACISHKKDRIVCRNGTSVVIPNDIDKQRVPCLDAQRIQDLAVAARHVEAEFKKPMDIEFTILGGTIYLLQARPLEKGANEASFVQEKFLTQQGNNIIPVEVIGAANSQVRFLTKDDCIVANNLRAALATFVKPENCKKIQAIIVETNAPATSHEAAMFRALDVPTIYVANADKQLQKQQQYILDVQHGFIIPFDGQVSPEQVVENGWYCHPIPKKMSIVADFFPELSHVFNPRQTRLENGKEYTRIGRCKLAPLLELLKIGKNEESIMLALQTIVSSITKAIPDKINQQHKLVAQHKETNSDIIAQLELLLKHVQVCAYEIQQASSIWLKSQRGPQDRIAWLYPIVFLEAVIKQSPAFDNAVNTCSITSLLNNEHLEQGLAKYNTKADNPCRAYIVQCAKLANQGCTEDIQREWQGYIRWLSSKPQQCQQHMSMLIAQLQQLDISALWLNESFAHACNQGYAKATVNLLKEFADSREILKEMHELQSKIHAFPITTFEVPNNFEAQLKNISALMGCLMSEKMSKMFGEAPKLARWSMISTMKQMVDCADSCIKSLENSSEYANAKDDQAKRMYQLVRVYLDLLKSWAAIPSIQGIVVKKGYSSTENLQKYLCTTQEAFNKFIPSEYNVGYSPYFDVSQNLFSSTKSFNEPSRLGSWFSLIHQNLLVLLSAINDCSGPQDDLFAHACAQIANVHIDSRNKNCSLVNRTFNNGSVTFEYILPVQAHNNTFYVTYDRHDNKHTRILMRSHLNGVAEGGGVVFNRWQERADWAHLFAILTNIHVESLPQVGASSLDMQFEVHTQDEVDKVAKFYQFLPESTVTPGNSIKVLAQLAGATFEKVITTITSMLDTHPYFIICLRHLRSKGLTQHEYIKELWKKCAEIMSSSQLSVDQKNHLLGLFDRYSDSCSGEDWPILETLQLLVSYINGKQDFEKDALYRISKILSHKFDHLAYAPEQWNALEEKFKFEGNVLIDDRQDLYEYAVNLMKELFKNIRNQPYLYGLQFDMNAGMKQLFDELLDNFYTKASWQERDYEFAFEVAKSCITDGDAYERKAAIRALPHLISCKYQPVLDYCWQNIMDEKFCDKYHLDKEDINAFISALCKACPGPLDVCIRPFFTKTGSYRKNYYKEIVATIMSDPICCNQKTICGQETINSLLQLFFDTSIDIKNLDRISLGICLLMHPMTKNIKQSWYKFFVKDPQQQLMETITSLMHQKDLYEGQNWQDNIDKIVTRIMQLKQAGYEEQTQTLLKTMLEMAKSGEISILIALNFKLLMHPLFKDFNEQIMNSIQCLIKCWETHEIKNWYVEIGDRILQLKQAGFEQQAQALLETMKKVVDKFRAKVAKCNKKIQSGQPKYTTPEYTEKVEDKQAEVEDFVDYCQEKLGLIFEETTQHDAMPDKSN